MQSGFCVLILLWLSSLELNSPPEFPLYQTYSLISWEELKADCLLIWILNELSNIYSEGQNYYREISSPSSNPNISGLLTLNFEELPTQWHISLQLFIRYWIVTVEIFVLILQIWLIDMVYFLQQKLTLLTNCCMVMIVRFLSLICFLHTIRQSQYRS